MVIANLDLEILEVVNTYFMRTKTFLHNFSTHLKLFFLVVAFVARKGLGALDISSSEAVRDLG